LRYIAKRKASDYTELTGMNDVKAALELGMGVGYSTEYFRTFADVRYGAIGHKGVAGEAGADLIWRTGDLTLTAGPRVQFGNAKFANTYFGVTAAESTASGLAAFNAGGGIYGAGLEIGATYKLSEDWGIAGAATWTRMQGDAKNSPIVTQGDKDQFGVRVGLTRRVTFGF
jgi:outer membrane scaffolding protein for murein synthesis (MipA/OmpV family)